MEIIDLIKVIILGMVEGLTEFAPISSTGHMIVVDDLWLHSDQFLSKYAANTFKVVIQLGSICAVVVVFKERFKQLFKDLTTSESQPLKRLKFSHILAGLLPAVVLGLFFEDFIDEHLFSVSTVGIGLILGSFLMMAADKWRRKAPLTLTVDDITHRQAFTVGLIQCFSLWPGFSRSGSTISGGVLLGMSYRSAADFTFIMAVPIMLGASGLSLMKNWSYFTLDAFPYFAAGFITAFLFALLSIRFFLNVIQKVKLMPFAIYRLVLAAAVYLVYF
ncbi:undecaprenyl-diphosphate phosphatase [Halobacillus sp. A5]|uniref:undecaprenyl-diphosphate phosphatase n=1 Tax=Halobacillus sp. A5 TaxID=2880263 RepID=UPI0020A69570|nr:undecaprenyl-diphosphate phosphatase [Halobacillus sp. A5]MCP3026459.1 undecaprenyl-diphosphate phosphatase [Halobacillus sp. A5]